MRVRNKISVILLTTAIIILLGLAAVLQNNTIIEWWKPVSICIPIALIFGFIMSGVIRQLTNFSKYFWNIIIGSVFSFSLLIGSFYSLNYYKSDEASQQKYSARVVNKFSEDHYHSQRVSRSHVRRGEKYKVYFINVELQNGSTKKIEIPVKEYIRIKEGKHVTLHIEKGLFGIPVIKNLKFPIQQRESQRN